MAYGVSRLVPEVVSKAVPRRGLLFGQKFGQKFGQNVWGQKPNASNCLRIRHSMGGYCARYSATATKIIPKINLKSGAGDTTTPSKTDRLLADIQKAIDAQKKPLLRSIRQISGDPDVHRPLHYCSEYNVALAVFLRMQGIHAQISCHSKYILVGLSDYFVPIRLHAYVAVPTTDPRNPILVDIAHQPYTGLLNDHVLIGKSNTILDKIPFKARNTYASVIDPSHILSPCPIDELIKIIKTDSSNERIASKLMVTRPYYEVPVRPQSIPFIREMALKMGLKNTQNSQK